MILRTTAALLLLSSALGVLCNASPATKVFGVGLSKTGTTSLGQALQMLGLTNLHMDRAFVPFLFPDGHYDFAGASQLLL